jgi:hypothetical protein
MTGLLGTGPRATLLRVAPGKARGHVVSSQDETQHYRAGCFTTLRSLTVIHIQPPGLASPRARRILLGSSGPFDGLAHEPRSMVWPTSPGAMAYSWRVSCSLDAPAGPEASIPSCGPISTAVGLTNVVSTVFWIDSP